MAYNNYLIKVGSYIIPLKYIKANAYTATYAGQDLDSYRDTDGVLHRQALDHPCLKVEFETVPMLTNTEMSTLMSNIRSNYLNATEKKVHVSAYVPEIDSYIEGDCYIPDISFSIYGVFNNVIKYNSIRLAFIQY